LVTLDVPRVSTGPTQYKAMTGNVPFGTVVVVDSNYEGYSAQPLTDGQINPQGVNWTRVAWASSEHAGPHWIELRFPQPTKVQEVRLWGALDAGTLHVPRKVEVHLPKGDGWAPVEGQQLAAGERGLLSVQFPAVEVRALRVLQPAHGGSAGRPELMWISEVEAR
jgi:hypothetical protein